MKLTENMLRKMIKEESSKLKIRKGSKRVSQESKLRSKRINENSNSFYETKLDLLYQALDALDEAIEHERTSAMGEDPDLLSIHESLEGLIEAVSSINNRSRSSINDY